MNSENFVKVCRAILNGASTQREMAKATEMSLGLVNSSISEGTEMGYLKLRKDAAPEITKEGTKYLENFKVKNAIILAAGFGSRCIPLTYETPKGLLKVNGKPMIERQIEQLLEKDITEIIIVVGYLKERFEYLIDKYGVKLVYNPEYSTKNNLASLHCVLDYLDSSYILMSDNWIESNIFNLYEEHSWFSAPYFAGKTGEWCIKTTGKGKITSISIGGEDSLALVGPAYFSPEFSKTMSQYVKEYYKRAESADYYWEQILHDKIKEFTMYANITTGNVYEFENLEELRMYDKSYINDSKNEIMEYIAKEMNVSQSDVKDIVQLKEGMTNNSFKFTIGNDNYVFRMPGAGTDKLIDRENESYTYELLTPYNITDEVVHFNAKSGIKITKFYDNIHSADPFDDIELKECMEKVKIVHGVPLKSKNSFDIEKMIKYYVGLAEAAHAIRYTDMWESVAKVEKLFKLRKKLNIPETICHGDYAHINILMFPDGKGRLIDFEYSGMADPIMDISMFSIFAEFDRERIEKALKLYKGGEPTEEEYIRLYLYVALGGFLWSMWAQYKQTFGQEMGEYPMTMYRYMKEYYRLIEETGVLKGLDD